MQKNKFDDLLAFIVGIVINVREFFPLNMFCRHNSFYESYIYQFQHRQINCDERNTIEASISKASQKRKSSIKKMMLMLIL